jgi:hypothetical protein
VQHTIQVKTKERLVSLLNLNYGEIGIVRRTGGFNNDMLGTPVMRIWSEPGTFHFVSLSDPTKTWTTASIIFVTELFQIEKVLPGDVLTITVGQ